MISLSGKPAIRSVVFVVVPVYILFYVIGSGNAIIYRCVGTPGIGAHSGGIPGSHAMSPKIQSIEISRHFGKYVSHPWLQLR